jgi:hypothetical protein
VKLSVLPRGVSSQLRRNLPKHTLLRSVGASKGTLFGFIPVFPDGAGTAELPGKVHIIYIVYCAPSRYFALVGQGTFRSHTLEISGKNIY